MEFQVLIAVCGTFLVARLVRADVEMSPRVAALVDWCMVGLNRYSCGDFSSRVALRIIRIFSSAAILFIDILSCFFAQFFDPNFVNDFFI